LGAIKITRKLLFQFSNFQFLQDAASQFQRGGPWLDADVDPIFLEDIAITTRKFCNYQTLSEGFIDRGAFRPSKTSRFYDLFSYLQSVGMDNYKELKKVAVIERSGFGNPQYLVMRHQNSNEVTITQIKPRRFCSEILISNAVESITLFPSQRYIAIQDLQKTYFYDLYPVFQGKNPRMTQRLSSGEPIFKGSIFQGGTEKVIFRDNDFFIGKTKHILPFRWQAFHSHTVGALVLNLLPHHKFSLFLIQRIAGIFPK
jgi:hypothetical protein